MPGGLYQNWIYLLVLSGIGIDIGENLTSFPLAVCIKKIRKTNFLSDPYLLVRIHTPGVHSTDSISD